MTMQQTLLDKVFRADALAKAYFSTINTQGRAGKQKAEFVESAVAKASALLPELLIATEEAKAAAIEDGHSLAALSSDIESPPNSVDRPELGHEEASAARSEIATLRKLFPMTEWASVIGDDGPDIDLYASKRKKLRIVGGVLVAAVIVLAFISPAAAGSLGLVTAYLAVKVYVQGNRLGYWK